ncbi:HAD family hydrolase [Streptomyces sp. NPDC051822]|uniref:HAD family hydrolase n=1 Tax=Streptomyces sp. NPDC051822 TaxID=3365675 RepID=UPI0037A08CD5
MAGVHTLRPGPAVCAAARTGLVAVASANDGRVVRAGLTVTGLDLLFPIIVAREDVACLEPAPDAYLAAASRLGLNPASCLAYETPEKASAPPTSHRWTSSTSAPPPGQSTGPEVDQASGAAAVGTPHRHHPSPEAARPSARGYSHQGTHAPTTRAGSGHGRGAARARGSRAPYGATGLAERPSVPEVHAIQCHSPACSGSGSAAV